MTAAVYINRSSESTFSDFFWIKFKEPNYQKRWMAWIFEMHHLPLTFCGPHAKKTKKNKPFSSFSFLFVGLPSERTGCFMIVGRWDFSHEKNIHKFSPENSHGTWTWWFSKRNLLLQGWTYSGSMLVIRGCNFCSPNFKGFFFWAPVQGDIYEGDWSDGKFQDTIWQWGRTWF